MGTNQGGGIWFEPQMDTNETRIRVEGVGLNHEWTRMKHESGWSGLVEPRMDTNGHEWTRMDTNGHESGWSGLV
jgi:hypothetical protein